MQCCSYSVVTIHGAYIVSFSVESIVIYISTFRSMCAVPNMGVFCSSVTSCFPGMLLTFIIIIIIIIIISSSSSSSWLLTLREERKLRLFENKVLRRIFGPRKNEGMEEPA